MRFRRAHIVPAMGRIACAASFALAATLSVSAAWAEPAEGDARTNARALGYSGVEDYWAGDYESAHTKLEQSFQLLPVPSLGLWSARVLVKRGKWLEAQERYSAVARLPADNQVQQSAQKDAARELAELVPKIPELRIRVEGASPEEVAVTLDGVPVPAPALPLPQRLDPGQHALVGTRTGQRSEASLSLSPGQHAEGVLRFMPLEPAPDATAARQQARAGADVPQPTPGFEGAAAADHGARNAWRTAAWITLGAGAAGLATGVVAYVVGQNKYDAFPPTCNPRCPPEESDRVDSYNKIAAVHTVGLVAGGVLAAAGVTLLLVTAGSEPSPRVALRAGPAWARLDARF